MVNRVQSGTVIGLNAYKVWVETDVINALPAMSVVGLPDTAVNEARDRVKSAIILPLPMSRKTEQALTCLLP